MSAMRRVLIALVGLIGSLGCALATAAPLRAQAVIAAAAPNGGPHTVVVKLVERPGPLPYAFEPATFTVHHGDTLRFVQMASTMHNVHFKTEPPGAKLGRAAMSDYLTLKGQAITIVVDSRFVDGTYEIVCDPHETLGMHAFLTVVGATGVPAGRE